MPNFFISRAGQAAVLTLFAAACGGSGDLLLPGSGEPAAVVLLQGDGQNGRVGEPLPQPLVAGVTDATGRPVEGATVVFVLTDAAPGAAVEPDTVTTDADGRATTRIVLGTRPGTQAGQVRALGGKGTPTATADFSLQAVPKDANGIAAVSGQDQSGPVGAKLAAPLVVEVADAFGNPIDAVVVSWSTEGGGSVSAGTTTTGADGRTSVERTLGGTAGPQRTLATVSGLAGSPVAFVHTATPGAASGVSILSGDDQTGPVTTELPKPLVVQVRDASNNPVPGVAVTWVIGSGQGSVSPATSTTDGAGQSTSAWTLGPTPGPNTVSAVVSGIGVVEFSATATAGAPARLSVRTQPSGTAVSGVVLDQQPVIQLLDAAGNEATQSGVQVSVAIATGGGTLSGSTTKSTDGNGRAAFTDLKITGSPGTRTLQFSADNFAAITSGSIALAAVPTVTTITSDSPDPSRAGDEITVQFSVTAATGTPTGSVRVADGNDSCTGTLSGGQGSCKLRLNTVGSRTLKADYAGVDGFAASSDTEAHTVQPPLPSASQSSISASPATVTAGETSTITVTVRDAGGNPLAGRTVTLQASGGANTITPGSVTSGSNGTAVFSFSSTAVETKTISASADGIDLGSTQVTVEAIPTTTTITGVNPAGSSPAGVPVTVSFGVTADAGTPTGSVTVTSSLESTSCQATVAAGSCTLEFQTLGTHTLTATYAAAGSFAGSSGTATYDVTAGGR
jgi:Bacterial Ig-like domain (group 1)/Bacterial Ig-like domain (group 3)